MRRLFDVLQQPRSGDGNQAGGAEARICSGLCHFPSVLSRRQYGSRRRTIHHCLLVLSGYNAAMIEYFNGPCNWDRIAPRRLRQQIHSELSTWEHYSTSRLLDGSDPRIIHKSGFSDLEDGLGIHIELLPSKLTRRWQRTGLASPSPRT